MSSWETGASGRRLRNAVTRAPYASPTMIDDGNAIHYAAVERGTRVYGSDGVEVGKVDEVVDNYREHILDGIVIEGPGRELRFVDGPEVARTAERGVTLAITSAEAASLPPPKRAAATFRPNPRAGRLGRLFGGGWKRQ
jgi:sporulation protein YlmC with PRC-barrel domain